MSHTSQMKHHHHRETFADEGQRLHVKHAIERWKEKRKRRSYKHKVTYKCRQRFAVTRPRVGGRFVKKKKPGTRTSTEIETQRAKWREYKRRNKNKKKKKKKKKQKPKTKPAPKAKETSTPTSTPTAAPMPTPIIVSTPWDVPSQSPSKSPVILMITPIEPLPIVQPTQRLCWQFGRTMSTLPSKTYLERILSESNQ